MSRISEEMKIVPRTVWAIAGLCYVGVVSGAWWMTQEAPWWGKLWLVGIVPLFFLAWVYGVAIDPMGYAFFVGYVILLAATTVGVPNQHARHVTLPAYLALGIPVEGVVLIAAVDMLWDFSATALNSTGYLAATSLLPRASVAALAEPSPEPVAS